MKYIKRGFYELRYNHLKLNSMMLTEFVDYVYSFYGDKNEALYPLFNVDTDNKLTKIDMSNRIC